MRGFITNGTNSRLGFPGSLLALGGSPLAAYVAGGTDPTTVADFKSDVFAGTITSETDFDVNGATIETDYASFNGTSQYLQDSVAYTNLVGTLAVVFRAATGVYFSAGRRVLLAYGDSATANNYLELGVDVDRRVYLEVNDGGTIHLWKGASLIEPGTDYGLVVVYDSAELAMALNGTQEPFVQIDTVGTAGWLGDVTSGDQLTIGAGDELGEVRFWSGRIYGFVVNEGEAF